MHGALDQLYYLSVHAVYRPGVADELAYEISSLSTCRSCGEIIYSELLVLAEAVFSVVRAVVLNGWSPPGNLLEMQILEFHPRLNKSETLGM